jgi:LPS-assembly lipoprotein
VRIRLAFLLGLLVLLAGCGFHLRGTVALPPALSQLTLADTSPASEIAAELRRGLARQGVVLGAEAPMLLQLHEEQYSRRVLSVDAAGRARDYALGYVVRFSLRSRDGQPWLAGETVSVSRDLTFNAEAVLGSSGEEAQLKAEMRREAVNAILRRLQRAQPPAP